MERPVVSARGVYYDLTKSPYRYESPYGDIFKFSSAKKLEMYTRDVPKEIKRVDALVERHNLGDFITDECRNLMRKAMYRAFYRKIEG